MTLKQHENLGVKYFFRKREAKLGNQYSNIYVFQTIHYFMDKLIFSQYFILFECLVLFSLILYYNKTSRIKFLK